MARWRLEDSPQQSQRGRWRLEPATDAGTAFLRGLGDSLSLGGGDELMGGGAALRAALSGGDMGAAYAEQVARSRANLRQAERDRPLATGAGEIAGFLVPGFGAGKLAVRGASLAGRFARAGGAGAAFGGVSGALSGETPEERLRGGLYGAAAGAALGAGFHGLAEAVPGALRASRRALRIPESRGLGIAGMAADDLVRTAQQNRSLGVSSIDDVSRVVDEAAQREPTMMVGEALGQPGTQRLAFFSRARGETGQRVEQYVRQRNLNQTGEVEETFLGRAPASGDELEQLVKQQWETRGPQLYEPMLSSPLRFENLRAFAQLRRSSLWDHDAIQSAWRRSGPMIKNDIALGRIPPGAANSLRHRLHYTKVSLDEMIADPTKLEPGLRSMNNASVVAARNALLGRFESIIPGYTAARAEMADIGAARRAIQMGRQAFTRQRFQSPEALARHASSLTAGERPYFVAGAEDAIARMIEGAAKSGRRNVAASMLGEGFNRRLTAIFGEQEARPMIERARRLADMFDSGNRARPSTGSISSNMAFEAADLAAPPIPTRENMLDAVWRYGWNNTLGRVGERHRDMMGRLYAMPVGEFQRRRGGLFSRANAEAARRQEQQRLSRTREAYLSGIGAAGIYDPREQ